MNKSRPKRSNKISIFQPVIRLHDVHTNKYTDWAFNSFVSQLVSSVLFMVEQLACLDFSRAINSTILPCEWSAHSVCWLEWGKIPKNRYKNIQAFVVIVVVDTTKQNGITEAYINGRKTCENAYLRLLIIITIPHPKEHFYLQKTICQRQNSFHLMLAIVCAHTHNHSKQQNETIASIVLTFDTFFTCHNRLNRIVKPPIQCEQ